VAFVVFDQGGQAFHPVAAVVVGVVSMVRMAGVWMWPQTTPWTWFALGILDDGFFKGADEADGVF